MTDSQPTNHSCRTLTSLEDLVFQAESFSRKRVCRFLCVLGCDQTGNVALNVPPSSSVRVFKSVQNTICRLFSVHFLGLMVPPPEYQVDTKYNRIHTYQPPTKAFYFPRVSWPLFFYLTNGLLVTSRRGGVHSFLRTDCYAPSQVFEPTGNPKRQRIPSCDTEPLLW